MLGGPWRTLFLTVFSVKFLLSPTPASCGQSPALIGMSHCIAPCSALDEVPVLGQDGQLRPGCPCNRLSKTGCFANPPDLSSGSARGYLLRLRKNADPVDKRNKPFYDLRMKMLRDSGLDETGIAHFMKSQWNPPNNDNHLPSTSFVHEAAFCSCHFLLEDIVVNGKGNASLKPSAQFRTQRHRVLASPAQPGLRGGKLRVAPVFSQMKALKSAVT